MTFTQFSDSLVSDSPVLILQDYFKKLMLYSY